MGIWRKAPSSLVELFDETINSLPDEVEKRKMFGYPCCFLNGNLWMGLHQESWILRLSEEDRAVLKDEHGVEPFEPIMGRKMREYIILPEEMVDDDETRALWIAKALTFARSLPPKA